MQNLSAYKINIYVKNIYFYLKHNKLDINKYYLKKKTLNKFKNKLFLSKNIMNLISGYK